MITSITAYDNFERAELFDTSGVGFEDADTTNSSDLDVFSQELRISSNNDSNLYWTAGLYYSTDELQEGYFFELADSFINAGTGIDEINIEYQQETESIAGFAHLEWQFHEQLKLTLGGRYTSEDREWSGCTNDSGDGTLANAWNNIFIPFLFAPAQLRLPTTPVAPGGCAIYDDIPTSPTFGEYAVFSEEISANEWMWKVSLDYQPLDDVLVYATISRGFKSGGFNGAPGQIHSQHSPIEIEKLTSYELGAKSTLLNGRMRLNAAIFYYDYKDKQEPTLAVTPVTNISGLTNIPESRVVGAELEGLLQLTQGLRLNFGMAYVDTEIEEYIAIDGDSAFPNIVTFDNSGDELTNAPRWQLNGTLSYEWGLQNGLKLMLATDVSHKSDHDTNTSGPLSDYTLVNARGGIGAADGRWDVTLWARNILDDYYWHSSTISNCCFVRLNGMPVTYGVTGSYNF